MILSIRLISSLGSRQQGEAFAAGIGAKLNPVSLVSVKSFEPYWKMPGRNIVLLNVPDWSRPLHETIVTLGHEPVCMSNDEAVFDVAQGSSIEVPEVDWLHVELIHPPAFPRASILRD